MSTVAFGALTTSREQSDSGTSTSAQPPGMNAYIDVLAALVPAEVLAIHALIIAATVTRGRGGQLLVPDPTTFRWTFWLLVGLTVALFLLGRRPVPAPAATRGRARGAALRWQNLEWQDLIRACVAPASFVCWTMAEPLGVWSAVAPGMSSGMRLLIPMVGAVLLAAVTKALASHADKKPSARQRSQLTAPQATAPEATGPPAAALAPPYPAQVQAAPPGQPVPTEQPAPADHDTVPPALPAGGTAIESVPNWVY